MSSCLSYCQLKIDLISTHTHPSHTPITQAQNLNVIFESSFPSDTSSLYPVCHQIMSVLPVHHFKNPSFLSLPLECVCPNFDPLLLPSPYFCHFRSVLSIAANIITSLIILAPPSSYPLIGLFLPFTLRLVLSKEPEWALSMELTCRLLRLHTNIP